MNLPFKGTGKIVYDPFRAGMKAKTDWWVVIEVDKEITRYYRWWLNYQFGLILDAPAWDAHCSVVRSERPKPGTEHLWKKLHGKVIDIDFGHIVKNAPSKPEFWYIDAYAPEIDEIRNGFGLKTFHDYHITVAKSKFEQFPVMDRFI